MRIAGTIAAALLLAANATATALNPYPELYALNTLSTAALIFLLVKGQ